MKRITTADIAHGDRSDAIQIWPTARPVITVERGERLTIPIRIRSLGPNTTLLKLGPNAPDSWKLRREASGDHWLDLSVDASGGSFTRSAQLVIDAGENRTREVGVYLSVNIPAENLLVTPSELDFGELPLSGASRAIQRVGIRKIVGSFQIKSLSSTLSFLKLESTTIVEGSNYRIRISIDPAKPLKAGDYSGNLIIETNDNKRVQVPIKLKLVDR